MWKVFGGKKHLWPVILLIVVAILIAGCTAAFLSIRSKLNRIDRDSPTETVRPEDEYFETDENTEAAQEDGESKKISPEDIQWPADADIMKDKDIMNIMLIGQDRGPGESRARSDSMMILTVNNRNKTVKVTSLMRDMYVQIPGYSDNRINASYAFGGMELLDATIEKNFLVEIDGNIEVDFDGFREVIDRIGGVSIEISGDEAAYLRKIGFQQ